MPTVDITAPAGAFTPAAVGNGQDLTTTFTIGSGSTSLICNGASPFVSGDTGKSFFLYGAGASGGILSGTMTFVSSTQMTLSVAAGTALSAASARLVWGSDDSLAWQACNNWATAQISPVTVNLGTGTKIFLITGSDTAIPQRSNSLAYGMISQPITINGNGPSSTKVYGGPRLGAGGIMSGAGEYSGFPTTPYTARLQSVSAGSTQVTCITASDTSQFPVNTWGVVCGIDMQASGYPPNQYYFDFVFITGVNAGTGVITFNSALKNSYLRTWPNKIPWSAGTTDYAGPATLYALDPKWGLTATYQNMSMEQPATQIYPSGLNITFNNVTSVGSGFNNGITPSVLATCTFIGCTLTGYTMEVDKLIDTLIFDSTIADQILNQSTNNKQIYQNGCTIGTINCGSKFMEVHNSTASSLILGGDYFGYTQSFITTGSTISSSLGYSTAGPGTSGDATGVLQNDYSMTGGVIKMPKANITYGCPWQIPGNICFFDSTPTGAAGFWGPMFRILSVTDDASNIYVTTDWPYGGFPSWARRIIPTPGQYTSFDSATVSSVPAVANWVTATSLNHNKVETYVTNTLNGGGIGFPTSYADLVSGNLVSYTINVTTPYTGVQPVLFWHAVAAFDNAVFVTLALSLVSGWAPHIDLKTAGKRVITPSGANSLGADSGLAMPDPKLWLSFIGQGLASNVDITAEYNANPSVGPVFTVELITRQDTPIFLPTLYRMGARTMR
jgi:hypothetical protein